jgi:hypothetical protein
MHAKSTPTINGRATGDMHIRQRRHVPQHFCPEAKMLLLLYLLVCGLHLRLVQPAVTLVSSEEAEDLVDLHFIGLVPVTGTSYSFGGAQIPVYEMAARDVVNAGVLDGYRLILHMEDTKVGTEQEPKSFPFCRGFDHCSPILFER